MNSPFNKAKYNALLEGLEIAEVKLSTTFENKDFRIDTDFYTKAPKINQKLKYIKIGNTLLNSQYGISIEMNEEEIGTPIYRMNEIHNMFCDLRVDKCAIVSKDELDTFKLNDRDVLFNRTNSYEWVGRTGIFREQKTKFIYASYLVRFVPNPDIIQPEYLTTFLNTKFGVWDLKRRARHSINQTNINPEEVKAIDIPLLNNKIQSIIKSCFDKSYVNLLKADSLYSEAEQTLLDELNLPNWQTPTENTAIKSFKESYLTTCRLDAEYYQKKYDDLLDLVTHYKYGFNRLLSFCKVKDQSFEPIRNIEYKYIELADIGSSGEITGCTIDIGINLPSRARRKVETGDVMVSSIEGSLESCALVSEEYNNAICSTGFYVIKSNKFNPECLLVLMKSKPIQMLLKQKCSGTILTSLNRDDFFNIVLPDINSKIQESIQEKIKESFLLRKESLRLLELTKQAVEKAIETSEEEAIEWIESEKWPQN